MCGVTSIRGFCFGVLDLPLRDHRVLGRERGMPLLDRGLDLWRGLVLGGIGSGFL